MKKIFLISLFLIQGFTEDTSKLNEFEDSLKKKKEKNNTSQNDSSTNKNSCSTHSHFNSNCHNCSKHRNNKSSFFDFFEDLESTFKIVKITYYIGRGIFFALTYPIQLADNLDNSDDSRLIFDKYPFYNSSGMYNYGVGRSNFFKSEISKYSFDGSVYGDKNKINFQNQRHICSFSYINLNEKYNNQLIKKNISYLMYSNMFSINNKTSNDNSIDFTLGVGLSTWKSVTYKDNGLRIKTSFNTFFKPFSINLDAGYSFIANGIIDLETKISYHYKRLSFSIGHQRYQIPAGNSIKGKTYSLGFWF